MDCGAASPPSALASSQGALKANPSGSVSGKVQTRRGSKAAEPARPGPLQGKHPVATDPATRQFRSSSTLRVKASSFCL